MPVLHGVLVLLLVSLGCDASQSFGECVALTHDELQQITGHWVLAWGGSDDPASAALLVNLSSSHVELELQAANQTVTYNEMNLQRNGSCPKFLANATVTSDPGSSLLVLQVEDAAMEQEGVLTSHNTSARLNFYHSCSDCLLMLFRSHNFHNFVLSYRREGKHGDADGLRAGADRGRQLATCLDFKMAAEYTYDGQSGLCEE